MRSGALSHAVAAALGHGSFQVTAKHYVQPGTLDGARTEPLVKMLAGDKAQVGPEPARLDVEQLLSSRPAETLTRLLEQASQITHP